METTCNRLLRQERTAMEESCHQVANLNYSKWFTDSSIIREIPSYICHVCQGFMRF